MDAAQKSLRRATVVFWALLLYIIAALLWWLFSLEQQNLQLQALRKEAVVLQNSDPKQYNSEWALIEKEQARNTVKHVAEGITFLLLILFGAVYIYRLVRRQFIIRQQQQNFVMAVTHELKTPLSVSRLNLETMQKRQLEPAVQQRLLQSSLQETLRLDTLINNILLATQLDEGAYPAQKEILDLGELCAEVLEAFRQRYRSREVVSSISLAIVQADPFLLRLLISNLLENAHKYSPAHAPITCDVVVTDGSVQLSVADKGPGIPEQEKKKVFDKFYRMGDENTRTTKGTGLGLFICQKVAAAHNTALQLTSNKGGGSIFSITFPLYNNYGK